MAEGFKNQLSFPQQEKSNVQLLSLNNLSTGIKLTEIDFASPQQQQNTQLRTQSTNQLQLSANNSIVSYSTAKTPGTLTQMTWIPAFSFPSAMSQRARFSHECAPMNVKSQKKTGQLPSSSHILTQNMPTDLANIIIKSSAINDLSIKNGNGIKQQLFSSSEDQSIPSQSNQNDRLAANLNSGNKNPITSGLKRFLKDYQDNQKRNICEIPNEILNLPYFDINKPKKSNHNWEYLLEEVKHSKEILDRSEWGERCHDAFLINIPMFESEDLRVIAVAALTMGGNCSLASCTKIERLPLDDPETERQKQINPLRPPPILIKFESPADRCRFTKEFNQHRFTVADFKYILKNGGAQDDRIYVEDNLTSKNREILQKAENLKRLKTIHDFKIIDGRVAVYMNEVDQGTLIFDVDDLYDILDKRVNSLQQLRLLYKQQINALTDQSINEYFEKWFKIKNDMIEDILEY